MIKISDLRREELAALEREYGANRSSLVVLYGRRRVGKTALISEFIKGKDALYYLVTEEAESQNRNSFREIAADHIGNPLLKKAEVDDWDTIFEAILAQPSQGKRQGCRRRWTFCLEVGKGPQPQLQPAFLADQEVHQGVLEGRVILCKLHQNAHLPNTEAVWIVRRLQKTGNPLLVGKGVVKGRTAQIWQSQRIHCTNVDAPHFFKFRYCQRHM